MTINRFICKRCGYIKDTEGVVGQSPVYPDKCPACGDGEWRRDYRSVGLVNPMMEHWNNTTGTVVSDMKGFKNDLKRRSDEATMRTGIEHNYEPIDYADVAQVVRDSDGKGLEDTNRARHLEGKSTIDL